jgi:DNA-binding NtrC family response regulator
MDIAQDTSALAAPIESPALCRRKGIVVIDDDPLFCQVIQAVAESQGLPTHAFESLFEMGSFACLREYDLAILDYRLDHLNGVEIAEYVDTFFADIPVILISADETVRETVAKWPQAVRRFVAKTEGPFSIVRAANEILKRQAFLNQF